MGIKIRRLMNLLHNLAMRRRKTNNKMKIMGLE